MNLHIEKASAKDLETIIDLLTKLYTELGEEADSITFLSPSLIHTFLESEQTAIFLIKKNQDVIGVLTLTESQAIYSGGKYGTIDEMYIKPDSRGNGIGQQLIEHVIAIAKEKNWKRIDVTAPTEEKWIKTVHFYEKCGFEFTGPKLKYII